jgi:hypothetical protein
MHYKKFIILMLLAFSLISPFKSYAASYALTEVATHNTPDDCWMVFEQNVYDITSYLRSHDKYLEIDSWCGLDMTEDFQTKAGTGRDHKSSTYALLDQYKIGDLEVVTVTDSPTTTPQSQVVTATIKPTAVSESSSQQPKNPYNLGLLVIPTLIIYWGWYFLCKKNYQCSLFKVSVFNFFWNSVLLITLIPAVGFGFFMVLRYSIPSLYSVQFDFLFWHVEGAIIMGTVAVSHFLSRLNAYFAQMRISLTKKP